MDILMRHANDEPFPLVKGSIYNTVELVAIASNLYKKHYKKIRMITIRPSLELMYYKYNCESLEEYYANYTETLKNIIASPFIGSLEQNKDTGLHLHLIIVCTLKEFKDYRSTLLATYDCRHLMTNSAGKILKQYSIVESSRDDLNNRVKYYLGLRKSILKPEYYKTVYGNYKPDTTAEDKYTKEYIQLIEAKLKEKNDNKVIKYDHYEGKVLYCDRCKSELLNALL